MNRRSLLKSLGIGATAAVVGVKAVDKKPPCPPHANIDVPGHFRIGTALCLDCGQTIKLSEAMRGLSAEIARLRAKV